jgi:hypothetical protein
MPGSTGGSAGVPRTLFNLMHRLLQQKFRSQTAWLGNSATHSRTTDLIVTTFVVGKYLKSCPVLSNRRGLHHSTWSSSCAVSDCTRAGDLDVSSWLTFAAGFVLPRRSLGWPPPAPSRVSVSPARASTGSGVTSITGGTVFVCSDLFISLCAAIKSWPKLMDGLPLGMSSSRGRRSRSAFHAAMPPL